MKTQKVMKTATTPKEGDTNPKGTYCGIEDYVLGTDTCPLRKGACYWQHRQTMKCQYTEQDLTPHEFAERVGASFVTKDETEVFISRLRDAL